MLMDVGLIILFGFLVYTAFEKLKLPGLLGLLLVGMVLGPHALDLLSDDLMAISSDIRMMALIIILLRAGFGLNRKALKAVGGVATRMSFIPVIFEGAVLLLLSWWLFELDVLSAGMLGFVLAAVSPAVIVPAMLSLIHRGYDKPHRIPSLVLLASSVDDVVAITIFSIFINTALAQQSSFLGQLLRLPFSLFFGVLLGILIGYILVKLFERFHIRDSKKVLIILSAAIFLVLFEQVMNDILPVAALIGVMMISIVIVDKRTHVAERLAIKYEKIWLLAEVFLFVLVGATVNISLALSVGLMGILLILLGLTARAVGVFVATMGTSYSVRQKTFLTIAFMPKATVQAALGSLPLSLSLPHGELILAISVIAILITAPLGAIAIRYSYQPLLKTQA